MQRQESLNRLRSLFARLVAEVRGATALDHTDLHKICEDVLAPVLAHVLHAPGLRNLNESERMNFPGIDLGDAAEGIGVQVTSSADAKKLRTTVRKCGEHRIFDTYPRLYVYDLTKKQSAYRVDLSGDMPAELRFDPRSDVLDYTDVLARLAHAPVKMIVEIIAHLERAALHPAEPSHDVLSATESLWTNLLPLELPDELFVADLIPEAVAKRGRTSERKAAHRHLKELGLKFSTDWTVHERQVISFHDLSDQRKPIATIVDAGTVTPLQPEEYYGIGADFENAFKVLLRRCLQQKLFPRGVRWQNQEHMFIFAEEYENLNRRSEAWTPSKTFSRIVFERVPKRDDPEKTYHCKHLAFGVGFHLYAGQWFVAVKPEWFFSRDGYRRWRFAADRVEFLKRNERNQHVFNHLKFLAYFLRHDPPPDLFRKFTPYPFLRVGEPLSFDGAIAVNDAEWLRAEEEAVRSRLIDPLGDLPLFDYAPDSAP